jgi:hypothetical protein
MGKLWTQPARWNRQPVSKLRHQVSFQTWQRHTGHASSGRAPQTGRTWGGCRMVFTLFSSPATFVASTRCTSASAATMAALTCNGKRHFPQHSLWAVQGRTDPMHVPGPGSARSLGPWQCHQCCATQQQCLSSAAVPIHTTHANTHGSISARPQPMQSPNRPTD